MSSSEVNGKHSVEARIRATHLHCHCGCVRLKDHAAHCSLTVLAAIRNMSTRALATTETPRLADFTTDFRVIPLSLICIVIGVIGAYLALILLKLIYLFTNLFF